MTARRWLTSAILAVFTLLPSLQLHCEIACADDAATTSAIGEAADESIGMPLSLSAPDDCVGQETPSPILPGPTSVHRPILIALIVNTLPDLLPSGFPSRVPPPFDDARPRGSTGVGIPLRI